VNRGLTALGFGVLLLLLGQVQQHTTGSSKHLTQLLIGLVLSSAGGLVLLRRRTLAEENAVVISRLPQRLRGPYDHYVRLLRLKTHKDLVLLNLVVGGIFCLAVGLFVVGNSVYDLIR
jgi:LPXTG-motif cell wall-anchored protein